MDFVSDSWQLARLPAGLEWDLWLRSQHGGSMTTTTFDTLEYFEKLKKAGVPEEQAKVQVEVMQSVVKSYDTATRKELATKGDLANTKHEILKWVMGIALAQTAVIVAVIGVAIALIAR